MDLIYKLKAIKRVLKLTDGYISTQNQDLLLGWNGGEMTWGELRQHLQTAIELLKDIDEKEN